VIVYRVAVALALPFLLALTLWQRARGRLAEGAILERLGRVPAPQGRTLWLHGASLGEVASARWLLERLLARDAGLSVLVTCNTATARAMVQAWALPRVTAALAPLEGQAARTLRGWRPCGLIVVENELWPLRIAAADAAGCPVLVIGARMSERSARRWAQAAPRLIAGTLARVAWLTAQDEASAARLVGLGLPADRLGPTQSLKALAPAPPPLPPPFAAPAPRARTLLAASTHDGEEAGILSAFAGQLGHGPFAHLILAPRHAHRGDAVAALVAAQRLTVARRSRGEVPVPATAVHLADTVGEMAHWYAMAGATVIGGSFARPGGHSPYEPAAARSAIVHGPGTGSFGPAFAALAAAGAAVAVPGLGSLGAALAGFDAGRQQALATAASAALARPGGAEALVDAIIARLRQPSG